MKILLMSLFLISFYSAANAESIQCMGYLDRMISYMEKAAEAESECRKADLIESSLNYLGDARKYCALEGKILADRYLWPLSGQLEEAVLACGE